MLCTRQRGMKVLFGKFWYFLRVPSGLLQLHRGVYHLCPSSAGLFTHDTLHISKAGDYGQWFWLENLHMEREIMCECESLTVKGPIEFLRYLFPTHIYIKVEVFFGLAFSNCVNCLPLFTPQDLNPVVRSPTGYCFPPPNPGETVVHLVTKGWWLWTTWLSRAIGAGENGISRVRISSQVELAWKQLQPMRADTGLVRNLEVTRATEEHSSGRAAAGLSFLSCVALVTRHGRQTLDQTEHLQMDINKIVHASRY